MLSALSLQTEPHTSVRDPELLELQPITSSDLAVIQEPEVSELQKPSLEPGPHKEKSSEILVTCQKDGLLQTQNNTNKSTKLDDWRSLSSSRRESSLIFAK